MPPQFADKLFPENHITTANEGKFIALRVGLQLDLIEDWIKEKCVAESSEEQKSRFADEWHEKYAVKFGEIFHKMIVTNSHFVGDMNSIPNVTQTLIAEELYRKPGVILPGDYD